jgi:hypothetical protein
MSEQPTKMIPIDELRTEPGSEELAGSASMKPYMEVLKAAMGGQDTSPALDALAHCLLSKDMSGGSSLL